MYTKLDSRLNYGVPYMTLLATVGRPKRERPIVRVNYKIDEGLRNRFKEYLKVKRLAEGVAVEKAMMQMMAIDRLVNQNVELTYQSIEKEIENIWLELTKETTEND